MEKKYPYLSEDGKTIFLAPGYATETKETWEKREQLPPPPKAIIITRQTSKMIDITDMSNEDLDNLLFNTPSPEPVIDMIAFFFLP